MSRSQTGKTSRLVILMRLYFWAFLWSSPAIWLMWKYGGVKEGQTFGDVVYTHADEVASHWFFPKLLFGGVSALLAIVWLLTRMGAWLVVPNDPDFVAWKKAGGDPFFDVLLVCNGDPPQVRAAIGVPPDSTICRFCGCDTRSLFGSCNFGNRCDNCGNYNDYF